MSGVSWGKVSVNQYPALDHRENEGRAQGLRNVKSAVSLLILVWLCVFTNIKDPTKRWCEGYLRKVEHLVYFSNIITMAVPWAPSRTGALRNNVHFPPRGLDFSARSVNIRVGSSISSQTRSGRTDILSAAVYCMAFPLRAIDQCDTEARVPKQAAPFLVDKVENGGRTNAAAPSDPA